MKTQRLCIYPKDIQRITGKSERSARRLLANVKEYFGKQPHHLISAEEFAEYTGLDAALISEYLTD
ncbi:MAG: hypothetical protein CMC13_06995 [Flavobacteriaceae bacterium]|nr:hypothetical protein [Flavobacteriaceae bacterium]|tara:strand:+ start:1708 stop:1905 length:198 start_codon:yes stop_codon:yes gene_type:complete